MANGTSTLINNSVWGTSENNIVNLLQGLEDSPYKFKIIAFSDKLSMTGETFMGKGNIVVAIVSEKFEDVKISPGISFSGISDRPYQTVTHMDATITIYLPSSNKGQYQSYPVIDRVIEALYGKSIGKPFGPILISNISYEDIDKKSGQITWKVSVKFTNYRGTTAGD